tara:strand:+ start:741 stop:1412 length:672 start_codon:yes stop_codon:yes gene_type:complete
MIRDIIIAIDGHSGCGKSTTSKLVAEHFNYKYLDSGAMYRAITLYLLRNKISYDNEDAIRNNLKNIIITFKYVEGNQNTFLNNENVEMEIRGDKISNNVSKYSSISIIREHLVSIQKQMGKRKKIVVEGRDITTVVFPDAEIKIFMTADIEVRAKRRFEDMKNNNPEVTYSDVLENLSERDSKDSNRKDSPLRVADEAIVIDTSDLEINEQTHKIIDIIKNKF